MEFVIALLFLSLLAAAFVISTFLPTAKEMTPKERQLKAALALALLAVPLVISLVLILFMSSGIIRSALP
jgi:CBS domain containing-hemolysin-like protein